MSTKEEFGQAVYGDEAAIAAVAAKIDSKDPKQEVTEVVKFELAKQVSQQRDRDIWEDSLFRQLFFDRDKQLRDEKPYLEYGQRFLEAARDVRALIDSRRKAIGQTNQTNGPSSAESDSDGEPTPDEVSDTIQQMARGRGQSVASVHRWKVR